jgi:hypothetical protein
MTTIQTPATQPTTPGQHRNGFGIASFVCGLTATVVGLIPILSIPALAAAVVGLGLGAGNIGRLRRHTADNKWMTILGVGFSVLGTVLAIIGIVIVTKAVNQLNTDLNNLPTTVPTTGAAWCQNTVPPQC